jgi:hypothetical protein
MAGALLLVIAVAVGVLLEQHPDAAASPKVTWSQPNVLEFLLPSQARTMTLTFRSDQTLNKVAVFVSPSLSSVLMATPTTFSKIVQNQPYQLSLNLKAGAQSEVKFDGTIQLKSTIDAAMTYARPLSLTVVVHNQPVPPDPGLASDQTIAGIDSDSDGVRDDVQRYIVLNYVDKPQVLNPLLKYAAASQSFLSFAIDKNSARAIDSQRERATRCLVSLRPEDGFSIRNDIRARQLNTASRRVAYDAADNYLSGMIFTPPPFPKWGESCSEL